MQAVDMREKQINIRLSDEEAARFERVAAHYGLNVAGTIRMLFKREDDALARADVSTALANRASAEAWMKASKEQGNTRPATPKAKSRSRRS